MCAHRHSSGATSRFAEHRSVLTGRESKRLQEMLQGLAEVTSTLLQKSPICVSSKWSANLSLSPTHEQQSSRDTHFPVTPVTLRWASLVLHSCSRSPQRPPSVFALSLWLILWSGDDLESALLQDSQLCFLHHPGRVWVSWVSRRDRNKQVATANLRVTGGLDLVLLHC